MKYLLACLIAAASMAAPALEIDDSGAFRVDGLLFQLAHWDPDWGSRMQGPESVKPAAGFPKRSGGAFELEGEFSVRSGTFRIAEKLSDSGEYQVRLTGVGLPVPTGDLALDVRLPVRKFTGRPILADGQALNFKESFDDEQWAVGLANVAKLELPLERGILELSGKFSLRLQDDRKFGSDAWDLRIKLASGYGQVKESSLALRIAFRPYAHTPVDLRSAANMGFADETPGDGRGGWTDQGPDNDLRMLPSGVWNFAGIDFNVIDVAGNGGKSCIVLRGPERPGFPAFAEVSLAKPVAAKYLYVLHAVGWEPSRPAEVGTIFCEDTDNVFVEKSGKTFRVMSGSDVANFWMPRRIENAQVGWKHENPSSTVGLYVTRFELSGKPLRKIVFESAGNAVWMIVGATLSDHRIEGKADGLVIFKADGDWVAFSGETRVRPESILDFSGLLDAPAGKYGRVQAAGGHLEFENRPGVPVRFYGGNIAFETNYMENADVAKMVEDFAATGYNIVRLHHYDKNLPDSTRRDSIHLNAGRLDRLDYTVAAFKARGVYTTLDLYTIRVLKKGEIPGFPDRQFSENEFKALIFVNEDAMRNFLEFSAALLDRVNPYTGLSWKEDPAIVSVCLVNEDTIFATAGRSPLLRELYEKKFRLYVEKHQIALTPQNRDWHYKRFLSETYLDGFRKMRAFFDKLGVRALITDQNFWSTVPVTLLRENYDIVDNHFYWGHPTFLGNNWSLLAAVSSGSAIGGYAGGISAMFAGRIYGKPFSVTEWDYVNPNPHSVEGAFLVGAYSALQDYSMLCRFTYTHSPQRVRRSVSPIGFFDTAGDPLRLLSERAGVVAFLRGDVRTASVNYPLLVSRGHLASSGNTDQEPGVMQRLGLIGKTGTLIAAPGVMPRLPEGTHAVIGIEDAWKDVAFAVPFRLGRDSGGTLRSLLDAGAIAPEEFDPAVNFFRSCTGELELFRNDGMFKMVTPRSEGFVLKAGQELTGNFASVKNRLTFGAFLASAMDGKPLAGSDRILILHLTDTKNSGMKFRDSGLNTLEEWGMLPLLIRRGEAEFTVRVGGGWKLYACGFDGNRLFEVPGVRDGRGVKYRLSTVNGDRIVAVYELVK